MAETLWAELLFLSLERSVWQGTLIASILAMLFLVLPRRRAGLRYTLALAALMVIFTLPVVTFFNSWTSKAQTVTTREPHVVQAYTAVSQALERRVAPVLTPELSLQLTSLREGTLWPILPWADLLVLLYLVGVFVLAGRFILQILYLSRLQAMAVRSSALEEAARPLLQSAGITGKVQVALSHHVDTAMVLGCFKPLILLPVNAAARLTPQQLKDVLLHELMHIRRHDYLVNLLQRLAETLLFYHPMAWWVSAQVQKEREHCCDDAAVSLLSDRYRYAEALLALEKARTRSHQRVALAGTGGNLNLRIRRLFNAAPSPRREMASLLAALLFSMVLASAFTLGLTQDVASPKFFERWPDETAEQAELLRQWPATAKQTRLDLTAEELLQLAPFKVFILGELSEDHEVATRSFLPELNWVTVAYHPTQSRSGQPYSFTLTQMPVETMRRAGHIGAATPLERVWIGTARGELVTGAWTTNIPDNASNHTHVPLHFEQPLIWDSSLSVRTLRWQHGSFIYEIVSSVLDKQAMLALAETMMPLAATPQSAGE